jgi:hypothetical protein
MKSRKPELWPSPTSADATGSRSSKGKNRPNEGGLGKAVRLWRTPQQPLTSSPGVSLVSLTRLQENVKALVTNVTSGRSSGESLAKLDPDGLWLKTYQGFSRPMLDGSLEPFSPTWPRWGTLLAGVLSGLSMWERGTGEIGCSLWLTPQGASENPAAHNQINGELKNQVRQFPTPQSRDWEGQSQRGQYAPGDCLPNAVMFPTPNTSNSTGPWEGMEGGPNLQTVVSGQLNPTWVEWLMGFPEGWTDLER